MRRRDILLASGAALALVSVGALPRTGKVHRVILVGTLSSERDAYVAAFLEGMRTLGYVEGRNLVFEEVDSKRDASDLAAVVDKAVERRPDVIVAFESIAQVVHSRTASIPIVLTGALNPVKAGLARSLREPGLNVTGLTQVNDQLPAKHLEILREIIPNLRKVGQMVDPNVSGCRIAEADSAQAARSMGYAFTPYYVSNRSDIERAFARMAKDPPDALLPCPSPVLFSYRDLLFENALRLRVPLTSYVPSNVPHGVLFAYATNMADLYRRSAGFVDKILRGANPGDLPIEQPTNFQFVVHLGTAKALGLTVPPALLLRANRVIE